DGERSSARRAQEVPHELTLGAQAIDPDGERSDGAAHEKLDRLARPDATARRVTLERWTHVSLERPVQEEFALSFFAVVEEQAREPAITELVVLVVRRPEAAGHDEIPLPSQPVVVLVGVDAVVRKVDHEQELQPTAFREIQGKARIEAEASADDDRGTRQLDGGHVPERVDVGAAVLRVVRELIDLAVAGRLFVEEHRVSAGEAADDMTPGRAPAIACLPQGQVPQPMTLEDLSPPSRAVVSQDRA